MATFSVGLINRLNDEQLEASATTNACTINDEQLVKKNENLKEKLASSQDEFAC